MKGDWTWFAAALWGFAEATFFFIVPDVLLMFVAARGLRRSLAASWCALGGAMAGGALMYLYGSLEPERARLFLEGVPAIQTELIHIVQNRIESNGWLAIVEGPLRGIPYKIYAVEWGADGRSGLLFLLVSIPARYIRFLLSPLFAAGIARIAGRFALPVLGFGWLMFYLFYFSRFGW